MAPIVPDDDAFARSPAFPPGEFTFDRTTQDKQPLAPPDPFRALTYPRVPQRTWHAKPNSTSRQTASLTLHPVAYLSKGSVPKSFLLVSSALLAGQFGRQDPALAG